MALRVLSGGCGRVKVSLHLCSGVPAVWVSVASVPPQKKPHCCGSWCGGRCCLHAAENETAIEVIIIDEQITGKSLVIEIRLQKLGCALQHSAIFGKLLGILFFIRPLAAIGFTEIVENGAIITAAAEGCHIDLKGFTLIVIEFGKLTD